MTTYDYLSFSICLFCSSSLCCFLKGISSESSEGFADGSLDTFMFSLNGVCLRFKGYSESSFLNFIGVICFSLDNFSFLQNSTTEFLVSSNLTPLFFSLYSFSFIKMLGAFSTLVGVSKFKSTSSSFSSTFGGYSDSIFILYEFIFSSVGTTASDFAVVAV